jgi:hypothetical protein
MLAMLGTRMRQKNKGKAMSDTEVLACDVRTQIKYVVRGEKATFYAGDRERSY